MRKIQTHCLRRFRRKLTIFDSFWNDSKIHFLRFTSCESRFFCEKYKIFFKLNKKLVGNVYEQVLGIFFSFISLCYEYLKNFYSQLNELKNMNSFYHSLMIQSFNSYETLTVIYFFLSLFKGQKVCLPT